MNKNDDDPFSKLTGGRKRKTRMLKESPDHSPNELFIRAMADVAKSMLGQIFYFNDTPVFFTEVIAPLLDYYGKPTSRITVSFLLGEKVKDITAHNWSEFKSLFMTRQEFEEERLLDFSDCERARILRTAEDLEMALPTIKRELADRRRKNLYGRTSFMSATNPGGEIKLK